MGVQIKTILIVEDEEEIREALETLLEDCGYEVFTAANGRIALEMLPKIHKPSLILLDLMMPQMNGWEFAHELGKSINFKDIPIVVMTAIPDQIKGIDTKEILRKPFDINDLLPTVQQYLS